MSPERERQTTRMFQVQREDGSRYVAIEVTTFSIDGGIRRATQIEWFLGGKSLIRDQSHHDTFRDALTGEIFRRVR
jgi:hypothetical protein